MLRVPPPAHLRLNHFWFCENLPPNYQCFCVFPSFSCSFCHKTADFAPLDYYYYRYFIHIGKIAPIPIKNLKEPLFSPICAFFMVSCAFFTVGLTGILTLFQGLFSLGKQTVADQFEGQSSGEKVRCVESGHGGQLGDVCPNDLVGLTDGP